MSTSTAPKKARIKTPKRVRLSMRHDPIHPTHYLHYDIRSACEDCSHFKREDQTCTIGYQTHWHLRENQQKSYELSGKIAICRFLEID